MRRRASGPPARPRKGTSAQRLSHLDGRGRVHMVDVSRKPVTSREAVARGRVLVSPAAMRLAVSGDLPKGAVAEVARIAGIQAAKRTADAIPLCHALLLSHVEVEVEPRRFGFAIEARVRTESRTGAEMEALHAVALAALTIYDMVKAVDKEMRIEDIRLVAKRGGQSGDFRAR